MRKPNKVTRIKRSFAFSLLYYWTKLTCLNPLTLSDDNQLRFSYFSLVFSILLIVYYTYIWYFAFFERLESFLPGETPIGIIGIAITVVCEFIVAVHAWIIFGFRQNRLKLVFKSFTNAEEISLKLNIRVDNEKSFRRLAIYFAGITSAYLIVWLLINFDVLFVKYRFSKFIWISYVFPQLISFNRLVIFIWTLEIVRDKFQRLNDKVRFLVKNRYPQKREDKRGSSGPMENSNCNLVLAEKIQLIAQLHRELRTAIYRTVEHIAVCVFIDILAQFLDMTICSHIVYRFLKGRRKISFSEFVYVVNLAVWIVVPIGLLSLISSASGSTADEANKTGKILHAALNDADHFYVAQEAAKFNVLSLDLLKNQLRISVFGFFDLNYYLVFKIVTTAVTYLTIMLQFYN